MRRLLKRVIIAGLVLAVVGLSVLIGLRLFSAWQAESRIHALESVPQRPVAIVFGAQIYGSGRLSAMLRDRVSVGAALYHAGRVQALLFTGDNSERAYNEPEAMRQYAMELGVPYEAIVLDYAGFNTYDSCYRARDIFQVDQAILVTQDFHLDRALLICNALGVESVGVAADVMRPTGYSRWSMLQSSVREVPATAYAVFRLLINDPPFYLGEPLPIMAMVR
jgi:SanA protein